VERALRARLNAPGRRVPPATTEEACSVKMKKIFCLATYWLLILAPVVLILFSMPQNRRLILAIPAGMVLALFWERGLKKWKQLWRVW
jgi:hypothetical protein